MSIVTIREALLQAMDEKMQNDERIIIMGEEVAEYNGPYKVTKGLWDKYGSERVIDTPIAELGFTGLAVGAAMHGMRPIVEWMTMNFGILALDQLVNNAAKMHYMSCGKFKVPMVIRGPNGPAEYLAAQHSQNLASYFVHVPGIKVVACSNAYNAKGLLKSAIDDDNPVIFLESELMYGMKGEISDEPYQIPLGQANVEQQGDHVSILSYGLSMLYAREAQKTLQEQGISAEIIDLQTLWPLDEKTIYDSVAKTNHVVILEEAWSRASVGSWISQMIYTHCFDDLDAPIELVQMLDVPMPYSHPEELYVKPSAQKLIQACQKVLTGNN